VLYHLILSLPLPSQFFQISLIFKKDKIVLIIFLLYSNTKKSIYY